MCEKLGGDYIGPSKEGGVEQLFWTAAIFFF